MKEGLKLKWFLYELGLFATVMILFYALMQVYDVFNQANYYYLFGIVIAFVVFVIAHMAWKFIAMPLGLKEVGQK